MFDDFFIRALTAGLGLALVTGPLGCFVIWRRLSFFAGTLAHSALLGVTLAFSFDINISFSVLLVSSAIALLFGDILAVNKKDLLVIWFGGAIILLILKIIWKPLFASTVNYELAEAEGMQPEKVNIIFTILIKLHFFPFL